MHSYMSLFINIIIFGYRVINVYAMRDDPDCIKRKKLVQK